MPITKIVFAKQSLQVNHRIIELLGELRRTWKPLLSSYILTQVLHALPDAIRSLKTSLLAISMQKTK